MNSPYDTELSELFSRDSGALTDEAFVQRCVLEFRRTQRQRLALKLVVMCIVAAGIGVMLPMLADLLAAASGGVSVAFSALDPRSLVPAQVTRVLAALDSAIGGIDRIAALAVVLIFLVSRYGWPSFRNRRS